MGPITIKRSDSKLRPTPCHYDERVYEIARSPHRCSHLPGNKLENLAINRPFRGERTGCFMFVVSIIRTRTRVCEDAPAPQHAGHRQRQRQQGRQRRGRFSGGCQPPQYLAELVVARVPGLKGSPDNWLKGLSLLTLLGPAANAPRIIKSFLEPSLVNAAAGCRETRVSPFSLLIPCYSTVLSPLALRGNRRENVDLPLRGLSSTAAMRHIHLTPSSKKLPLLKGAAGKFRSTSATGCDALAAFSVFVARG